MATKIVEIEVTKEDIRKGIRGNCNSCPISLAANRIFKTACTVETLNIQINGIAYNLPREAVDFIFVFDSFYTNHWVKPFKFNLEVG